MRTFTSTFRHFVLVSTVFLYILMSILWEINKHVQKPFIDEKFHIPQAQKYCQLRFDEWDPKITTLPGLYLVSLFWLKPLEWLYGLPLCSVYGLRFINVLGTFINFVICYILFKRKTASKGILSSLLNILSAINVATFPPLFFFTFLFYTDVWSTTFILLMYTFHSSKSYFLASLMGFFSILMRQTNVVWIGLMLINAAWQDISKGSQVSTAYDVFLTIKKCLKRDIIFRILLNTWPYVTICISFVIFVFINGGIVVGDKMAHSPVFHPMQYLYFLDFSAFFAVSFIIYEVADIYKNRPSAPILCTLWMFCAIMSEYNFIQHPYLLADNRHIAFYLWRRIFGNQLFRRLLTPTYVISGVLLGHILKKNCNLVFLMGLVLCTVASLVPQHLFEIRYFIIPYLMMRLNFPTAQQRPVSVCLETLLYAIVNATVIHLFLTRTFYWPSEPEQLQRIMW